MVDIRKLKVNKFYQYDRIVHSYYVNGFHDYLSQYKQRILKIFWQEQENVLKERRFNVPLIGKEWDKLTFELNDFLKGEIIKKYYVAGETWNDSGISAYVQIKGNSNNVFHHHHADSITATMYIDPIEDERDGGALVIKNYPAGDLYLYPSKNQIFLFPGWAYHTPAPQNREKPRICINWGFVCKNRVIHKLTGDKW